LNRNHWIAGIVILAVLGITGLIGLGLLISQWKTNKPQSSQKIPVLDLVYCNSENKAPCIVSFGIDPDDHMLVNLFVPTSSFPDFYLKIVQNKDEHRYKCQMVDDFPNSFYCLGDKLPPGGTLQFMLVSNEKDLLLAKGELPLIGLAYPTLGIALAPSTPTMTEEPVQTLETLISPQTTPNPSIPTKSSYPNPLKTKTPSYP